MSSIAIAGIFVAMAVGDFDVPAGFKKAER